MYLITRFNFAFKTNEFMTGSGTDWTLHFDKAAWMCFDVAEAYVKFHGPKVSIVHEDFAMEHYT